MIKLKCNACDGVGENDLDIRFDNKCDNRLIINMIESQP